MNIDKIEHGQDVSSLSLFCTVFFCLLLKRFFFCLVLTILIFVVCILVATLIYIYVHIYLYVRLIWLKEFSSDEIKRKFLWTQTQFQTRMDYPNSSWFCSCVCVVSNRYYTMYKVDSNVLQLLFCVKITAFYMSPHCMLNILKFCII